MANVQHSTLTGASLHESKGVAAAAANRVYVTNGLGSGSFTTVDNNVLATTAKPFQAGLVHYRDQQTNGTNGGSLSNNTWNTRVLNTEVTDDGSLGSLSSNQITLAAGTYYLEASATFSCETNPGFFAAVTGTGKLRIRNVTDGSTTLVGQGVRFELSNQGGSGSFANGKWQGTMTVSGRFTLGGTKAIELQQYLSGGPGTPRAGSAVSSGEVEVYADVKIWKVG